MTFITIHQEQQYSKRDKGKARIEVLLIEGLDSGPSTPMTPDDWKEIEHEGRQKIAARQGTLAKPIILRFFNDRLDPSSVR